jgi:hypothetical protein
MYMNCAVVDIVGASSNNKRDTNAATAAQASLSSLPDLFVANLASINTCRTTETMDPIFDNPGADVEYGDGVTASSATVNRSKSACTGQGRESAGETSPPVSNVKSSKPADPIIPKEGTYGNDGGSYGDDGKWHGDSDSQNTYQGGASEKPKACNDGQYHPECYGKAASSSPATTEQPGDDMSNDNDSNDESTDNNEDRTPEQTHAQSSKPTKRPKIHHKYNSDYSDFDYYYDRQVTTSDLPSSDSLDPSTTPITTPEPVPTWDPTLSGPQTGLAPPLDSDPDLIDNFLVVSDETTTLMAIVDGTGILNVAVPTDRPVLGSDGNLLVDVVPAAVESGLLDFLVPVYTSTPVPEESINGDFPGDTTEVAPTPSDDVPFAPQQMPVSNLEVFPTVVNNIDPTPASDILDGIPSIPVFTSIMDDLQLPDDMETFLSIFDNLTPTSVIEVFPSVVDDTLQTTLSTPTSLGIPDESSYWSVKVYFNTSDAPLSTLQDESLLTPTPQNSSVIPTPTTLRSTYIPSQSTPEIVLPDVTSIPTNVDISHLIPTFLLKVPFFKAIQDFANSLKKAGTLKNISTFKKGPPNRTSQDSTADDGFVNRQAVANEPDVCSDIAPVTVYVTPPATWYAENTPPASFSGIPGVDAPADCVDPQWNCGNCNSPDRCIRINWCTRTCTRLPYTGKLPLSTSQSILTPRIDLPTATPAPAPAIITSAPVADNFTPEQCPPQFVADPDPDDNYLPCRPGTFLCKSETQFYTCGQYGEGSEIWSYGALRDVAEGMSCVPHLTRGSTTARKLRRDVNALVEFRGKSLRQRQWKCLEKMKRRHGKNLGRWKKAKRDATTTLDDAVYGYCFDWYNGYRKTIAAKQVSPFKKWIKSFKKSYRKPLSVRNRRGVPIESTGMEDIDLSTGGDGIDEDPTELFGTEPADYEEEWPVEDGIVKSGAPAPGLVVTGAAPAVTGPGQQVRTIRRTAKRTMEKRQEEGAEAEVNAQDGTPEVTPADTQETVAGDAPEVTPEDDEENSGNSNNVASAKNYSKDYSLYEKNAPPGLDADEDDSADPSGSDLLEAVHALFPSLQEPDLVYDGLQDPKDPNTVLEDTYTYVDDDNEVPPFDKNGNPILQTPGPQVDAQGKPVTNPLLAPTSSPLFLNATATNSSVPAITPVPVLPGDDPNAPMHILPVLPSEDSNPPVSDLPVLPSDEPIPVSLLPYIMGPGPVVPPGVSINWPGPNGNGRSRPTVGPAVAGAPTEVMKRQGENMAEKEKNVRRQACPPVIPGYYRDDRYMLR